jgi:glycosyltransferase involved in cell wall biosynthesis
MEMILKTNGLEHQKIMFCPYGINHDHIPARPQGMGSKLRVGFIGTLYEHKGPHVLISALRSAPELPVQAKIYGKQNEFPEYVEQLRALAAGDERIEFCGTFPNHQIGRIFTGLDCLVVPSIWYENTPLVIYSAQAAGCPVIASNLGGMAEAVHHNVNGLLFEPGDVDGLASLLRHLCSDRSILPRLSAKSIKPKSSGQYAAEVEAVYHRLLSSRNAG